MAAMVLLLALALGRTASATPVAFLAPSVAVEENSGAASTRTFSYTVPAGTNRLLVVTSSGGGNNDTDTTSVKFNNSNMTLAAKRTNFSSGVNAGIWYVALGTSANPITANVTVTYANNFLFEVTASAFSNVDQVAPVSGAVSEFSSSVGVGSAPGSMVIDAIVGGGTSGAPGAGQTLVAVANDLVFNTASAGASTAPGAASVTMSWSVGGNVAHAAVSLTSTNPAVTSISPAAGPTTAGTTVIITGRNFTGATAVKFGATAATSFTFNSSTQITATAPAGTGTVDVQVTAGGITSATSAADQFTYVPAPTVTGLSSNIGPTTGGRIVTITGTNLSNATAVKFGATAATSFTVDSATQITATSPAATGTVDVRVTTVGGTSATSAADQFTFVSAPIVAGLSPAAGPVAGTTSVTISGFNFTSVTAVAFGATPATGYTVNSSTQITATSPAGTGTVDVKVTAVGGTSTTVAEDQYTYVAFPTLTSILPTAGPTTGGTSVVITGTNLTGATAVTFGATAATAFTVNSATQVTATSPAGTGIVDVRVTTVGGTTTTSAADQFTYVPAPTVTSLSPIVGPATGVTTVTITGTNFSGATAVTFGTTAATGFTVNSATQITATSPAGTGTVDVKVTTVGGTSATSAADQFTFVPAPTVISISPAAGPTAGTTSVTITGTNFTGATAVTFGATAATGFTVNSATQITATSPAGTGTVDVKVTTVGGISATSAADQFTYVPKPVVASLAPVSGPTIGGTSVTITGSNFSGATAVTFGATAATGFTVNSATQITATSPAGTGAVDVIVTTVGGPSVTSAADVFNFTTANHFTVTAPNTAAAGTAFNVTVTALDSFNNLARGYTGTVHFTSTDGNAVLPANATLTNGAGTFSTTLQNAGSHTVTATDTVSSGISGTSASITVGESITLAATDASASVGGVDTGIYRFTRGGNGAAVTVNFSLNGASTASTTEFALTGGTFNGSTGTVIIPAGSTSADVTLTATANATNIAKPSKTAQLNVASSSAYTVGSPSAATVTIQQNGFVVFNTSDSGQGSLRQAIANANANALAGDDTITFDSGLFVIPQTITLSTGSLDVGNNSKVIISGVGASLLTVSGNNASRVFTTSSGTADLTLYGLRIINGSASGNGGGVYVNGGSLTVIAAVIAGNTATASGGGVASSSGSTVRVINSTISGNSATGTAAAGGIDSAGPLTLTNTTLSGNSVSTTNADNAGGLKQAGTAGILNTTITNNSTGGSVGAGGMLVVSGTVSVGNTLIAANVNNGTMADVSGAFAQTRNNVIGNVGTATGFTGISNLTGTGAAVLDPQIGALAYNGGTTQTHLLLSGSPAINAGSNVILPADSFDLDADNDVAERLPLDQRGFGFPRVRGPAVDIGAVEVLIFTPALTAATTNEDQQSSSGLVITANDADAGGTTNYQITAITGGTLYKSDGTTAIASNGFITKAEGAAGLKFTPSANLFSPTTTFGFSVQASISANVSGLKDAVVPATITVNPVADTPSVTNTATTVNVQSVSGLVITRNAVDGAEIGFFKISNIQHGTLYQNNGTTVINAGDFITVAQGGAGLKFTSALDYIGVASFDVQGSVDNAGTGLGSGTATATIAIGTVNPTPVQVVPTDPITGLPLPPGSSYPVNSQSGMFEVRTTITNTTAFPINGFRLSVDYSAYLVAQPSLRLYNSSSAPGAVPAYIDYPFPVAVGQTISLKLQFYTSTRRIPNPFNPTLTVTKLAASEVSSTDGSGVQPRINVRPNGTVLLEWDSIPGRWYRVKYSADLTNWFDSPVPVQANANRTQWLDDGAPFTNVSPATVPQRFYRVNEIAAPVPAL